MQVTFQPKSIDFERRQSIKMSSFGQDLNKPHH